MEMSVTPDGQGQPVNLAGGRGTRIPDLRLLLAVHAARQAAEPTARIVREGDQFVAGDEPSRLMLIFAPEGSGPSARRTAAGSFNARVAAHLAIGADGESAIYPDA